MTVRDRSSTLLTRNVADHLLLSPDPSEGKFNKASMLVARIGSGGLACKIRLPLATEQGRCAYRLDSNNAHERARGVPDETSGPSDSRAIPEGSHFEFSFLSV